MFRKQKLNKRCPLCLNLLALDHQRTAQHLLVCETYMTAAKIYRVKICINDQQGNDGSMPPPQITFCTLSHTFGTTNSSQLSGRITNLLKQCSKEGLFASSKCHKCKASCYPYLYSIIGSKRFYFCNADCLCSFFNTTLG